MLSTWQADECMDLMEPRVGAIGHSHVALWFCRDRRRARSTGAPAEGGLERDLSEGEWLLNPGGVGQPRDGDPRAAWLLLDTEALERRSGGASSTRSTRPRARSRTAGLPAVLAERLYTGQ